MTVIITEIQHKVRIFPHCRGRDKQQIIVIHRIVIPVRVSLDPGSVQTGLLARERVKARELCAVYVAVKHEAGVLAELDICVICVHHLCERLYLEAVQIELLDAAEDQAVAVSRDHPVAAAVPRFIRLRHVYRKNAALAGRELIADNRRAAAVRRACNIIVACIQTDRGKEKAAVKDHIHHRCGICFIRE